MPSQVVDAKCAPNVPRAQILLLPQLDQLPDPVLLWCSLVGEAVDSQLHPYAVRLGLHGRYVVVASSIWCDRDGAGMGRRRRVHWCATSDAMVLPRGGTADPVRTRHRVLWMRGYYKFLDHRAQHWSLRPLRRIPSGGDFEAAYPMEAWFRRHYPNLPVG